jgi:hypothetical protein
LGFNFYVGSHYPAYRAYDLRSFHSYPSFRSYYYGNPYAYPSYGVYAAPSYYGGYGGYCW